MASAVTTAVIAAIVSSVNSLSAAAAIGVAGFLLLLIFVVEKEVLATNGSRELAIAARYLNLVIVPLIFAVMLIGVFRVLLSSGVIH
ncbi:MAG: hypothetical protein M1118_06375 [Chloroflexi bacterium]|nr:hypothetical protein [Chloroflexota bacterium]